MAISPADFDYVRTLVRNQSGIVLEPGKEYLVDARLSGLIRQLKIESIPALVERLRAAPADPLQARVVEAMTTNETSFFRDIHPFETLKKVILPEIIARRASSRTLSIWCGASSTGQEPYTIAMTLSEMLPNIADWKINFTATDLSTEMIRRSREGKYGQIEVNRGLPAPMLVKYFDKTGLEWQVKKSLRDMVQFREMNLTSMWPPMPMMDIIFMRNVLIYFDTDVKRQILGKARRLLDPQGYLFLGCAETTMGLDDEYARMQLDKSSCYRHKHATSKAA
ncbi:MAG TPA: protein-glutamate O-methyltransferase CheR [Phycisphaerae bacterium]|nr:protein-glutamate O-methyltransferase CheR [Phycisphaerae bacterium]